MARLRKKQPEQKAAEEENMTFFLIPHYKGEDKADFGVAFQSRNHVNVYLTLDEAIADCRQGDKIFETSTARVVGKMAFRPEV